MAKRSVEPWAKEWFWIDQICINQANPIEKCHQVSEMGDIYSMALATIVWPGPTAHTTKYTEEDRQLQTLLTSEDLILSRPFSSKSGTIIVAQHEQLPPSPSALRLLNMTSMALMTAVSTSAYWNRLWIVQEICLATEVRFILMNELWDFSDVYYVLHQWCKSSRYESTDDDEIHLHAEDVLRRLFEWAVQRAVQTSGQQRRWDDALQLASQTVCTEVLDNVYAMLGLVDEDLRFHPDYSKSPQELLKAILEKELENIWMCRIDPWHAVDNIILRWRHAGLPGPTRLVKHPPIAGGGRDSIGRHAHYDESEEARHDREERNGMRVFEALQVVIPPEFKKWSHHRSLGDSRAGPDRLSLSKLEEAEDLRKDRVWLWRV